MQRIALLILAFCSIAIAFAPRSNRISTIIRTRMAKEEQTITDLNLEQMFDTFEAADKTVSAADLPKGAVSKYDDKRSTVQDGSSGSSSSAAPIIALVAVAGLAAVVASKMM